MGCGPQLFSNALLTVLMIREEGLLSTLFANVLTLCDNQTPLPPETDEDEV